MNLDFLDGQNLLRSGVHKFLVKESLVSTARSAITVAVHIAELFGEQLRAPEF